MEVTAKANNIRMSPRKVRLVIDVIRGMDVARAQTQLQFIKKEACGPVLKLLNSAIANAGHNFDIAKETLYVKTITADGGPVLKRWTPKAFGRSAPIRKRTAHITIILDERAAKAEKPAASVKEAKPKKAPAKKPATKKTT